MALGVCLRLPLDTAAFCFYILAVGMRFLATHGIAGSTGISNFFLALSIIGVKAFNFVRRMIVMFPLLVCSLYCFFNVPLLLCFLLSTFGHV